MKLALSDYACNGWHPLRGYHVEKWQPAQGGQVTSREVEKGRIVAVGLLTQRELDILGSGFRRAIPLDQADGFEHLLAAIDDAERKWTESR